MSCSARLRHPHEHRLVLFVLQAEIKHQGDFTAFKEKLLPCLHLPLWRRIEVQNCRNRTC